MDNDILEKYKKAGKLDRKCLEAGRKMIKPGVKILDVVENIEEIVKKSEAGFSFPINISINEIAAHDTADVDDERVFKEGDLVKLDIGTHIDGYIADSAITVSLDSGKDDLMKASQDALKQALKMMKPGNKVSDISEAIENTIRNAGFNPIINLTGHQLDQYVLHAGLEFPNVKTSLQYELQEGDVFAIEPFATDGSGRVTETDKKLIYMFVSDTPTRFPESRKILKAAKEDFNGLPFTNRWMVKKIKNLSPVKLRLILRQLVQKGSIYQYPALKEIKGGRVAQFENTVIVGEKPVVTTA